MIVQLLAGSFGLLCCCANFYHCTFRPLRDRRRGIDTQTRYYPSPIPILGFLACFLIVAADAHLAVTIPVVLLMLADPGGLHWLPIWIVVMWYRSKKNGRAQ
jgi:hypothetical protein